MVHRHFSKPRNVVRHYKNIVLKQTFFLLLVVFAFLGCSSKKKNETDFKQLINNSIEKNPLGILYQTDTLKLTAQFSECGEFGGHKESIEIFCNYKREYFAKYVRNSINLDCPNNFEETAIIIKDTLFKIDSNKEKLIVKYLDKLYRRTLKPKMISHWSDYFKAKTKNSGLSLFTAEPNKDWKEFRKLQIELLK